MNRLLYIMTTAFILFIACNDPTTNQPEKNEINAYSTAIDSCKTSALLKINSDYPVRSYEFFDDSLKIMVVVEANCCPEINRFKISTTVKSNSIYLEVQDTAVGLCDCNCLYEIQTVIKSKGIDSIHFTCEYYDSLLVDELIRRD